MHLPCREHYFKHPKQFPFPVCYRFGWALFCTFRVRRIHRMALRIRLARLKQSWHKLNAYPNVCVYVRNEWRRQFFIE